LVWDVGVRALGMGKKRDRGGVSFWRGIAIANEGVSALGNRSEGKGRGGVRGCLEREKKERGERYNRKKVKIIGLNS